jgi:hypothetical protein
LVRAVDHRFPQQVWPDLVLRVFLTCVGLLIDRNQTHEAHQTPDTMATTLVVVALHVPRHLPRSIPWRFQELFVDDFHEPQVLNALTDGLIVKA